MTSDTGLRAVGNSGYLYYNVQNRQRLCHQEPETSRDPSWYGRLLPETHWTADTPLLSTRQECNREDEYKYGAEPKMTDSMRPTYRDHPEGVHECENAKQCPKPKETRL